MPVAPAHELLVAGHVDDADGSAAWQVESSKSQLNGDAATLFFDQAVGVGAGECLYERRFAVVDVARGANDDRGFVVFVGRHGCLLSIVKGSALVTGRDSGAVPHEPNASVGRLCELRTV